MPISGLRVSHVPRASSMTIRTHCGPKTKVVKPRGVGGRDLSNQPFGTAVEGEEKTVHREISLRQRRKERQDHACGGERGSYLRQQCLIELLSTTAISATDFQPRFFKVIAHSKTPPPLSLP